MTDMESPKKNNLSALCKTGRLKRQSRATLEAASPICPLVYPPTYSLVTITKLYHFAGTVWKSGTEVNVSWAITANHGGGYQYRLCPR